jgi:glycosyltransferase involved in cell wall biosynthesis
VGNLFPVKGHITALQAIEQFAAQRKNWRLLLAGEGPERARLEDFLSVQGWKDRVSFLGTSHRVPELLNALDVYVLPSIAEGISNSLLEAMASGIPVIATATGGNPEVVVDGESGPLFPIGNAQQLSRHLLLLHDQSQRRRELAQRALSRVREEFSIESMVGKYAQLYESMGRRSSMPVEAAAGV